jgi:hypothetical protein
MKKSKHEFNPGDRVYAKYLGKYPVRGNVYGLREDQDGVYFLMHSDLPLVIDDQTLSVLKLKPSQIIEYYPAND